MTTMSENKGGATSFQDAFLENDVLEARNKLGNLREACRSFNKGIEEQVEALWIKLDVILIQLNERDDKINDLKAEIIKLKEESEKLTEKIKQMEDDATTIEMGELVTVFGRNVSKYVLEPDECLGKNGSITHMFNILDRTQVRRKIRRRWMGVKRLGSVAWNEGHRSLIDEIRSKRNPMAHPSTINFEKVQLQIQDRFPQWELEGKDIMTVCKKLNCLLALGRFAVKFHEAVPAYVLPEKGVEDIPNLIKWLEDNQSNYKGKAARKRWEDLTSGKEWSEDCDKVLEQMQKLEREDTLVNFECDFEIIKSTVKNVVPNKEISHYIIGIMQKIPKKIWKNLGVKSDVTFKETAS